MIRLAQQTGPSVASWILAPLWYFSYGASVEFVKHKHQPRKGLFPSCGRLLITIGEGANVLLLAGKRVVSIV